MTRALAVNAMMLLLVVGMTAVPASAQDPVPPPEALKGGFPAQKHFSPYAGRNFPTQVFWGDRDFTPADGQNRLPGAVGYTKGVPMGGDLRNAPAGKAPSFLVAALKDPLSGNLDRIQIVKGWVDAGGERRERVYGVAWSGHRTPDADGKLPPVGNTVDVANATWTNIIGSPELIKVWEDPDFDPTLRAVYYARVLEIPTPRWTAYEAKRFGITLPSEVPMITQERAYTSPISKGRRPPLPGGGGEVSPSPRALSVYGRSLKTGSE